MGREETCGDAVLVAKGEGTSQEFPSLRPEDSGGSDPDLTKACGKAWVTSRTH